MAATNNTSSLSSAKLPAQQSEKSVSSQKPKNAGKMQQRAGETMADIATGRVKDLHQAALAIDRAEISMKLTLEIRNKALKAYKEVSRTRSDDAHSPLSR